MYDPCVNILLGFILNPELSSLPPSWNEIRGFVFYASSLRYFNSSIHDHFYDFSKSDAIFIRELLIIMLITIITTMISAFVAICILFANQNFLKEKAKKELMLTKLELAYNHTVQLNIIAMELCKKKVPQSENIASIFMKHALELNGLCKIYFPEINFNLDFMNELSSVISINMLLPEIEDPAPARANAIQHLDVIREKILAEIKKNKH